jgi:SAM-dependent methyltransferase
MGPEEQLVADWDRTASAIEEDPSRRLRYEKCFRYFASELDRDARICDVGCGEGTGLRLLQELGFSNLTGVEVSPERLRRARQQIGADVALVQVSPVDPLPFSDGCFDAVISAAVIEHTLDPLAHVQQLSRVTRTNGYVVIASDCYSFRILQLLRIYKSVQPIDRALFPTTLLRYFSASGLHLVHSEGFPAPGEEYRFVRILLHRAHLQPLALLATRARSVLRRLRMKHATTDVSSTSDVGRSGLESWSPNHWLRSMPRLVFSEENVFFLVKDR